MSQQQPVQQVIIQQASSNGLGTAGFVVSLIGWLTCGLLCPFGLLFSVIGLFKAPRGMAVAGAVLGAIGSWWLAFFGFAMVVGFFGLGSAAVNEARKATDRQAQEMAEEAQLDVHQGIELDSNIDQVNVPAPEMTIESGAANAQESEQPLDASDGVSTEVSARSADSPSAQVSEAEYRTWTDKSGKFQVKARLSGRMDDSVRLIKEDGSPVIVPIEKLSEDDLKYLEESK